MNEYCTILTNVGLAKIIKARAEGTSVVLKSFSLSSSAIVPSEEINALNDVVYSANINTRFVDADNPHHLVLECVLPADVGGFSVQSIGLYDVDNELIAVGSLPFTYKPKLSEGAAKEIVFSVVMELANVDDLTIVLDSSQALATREYVDNLRLNLLLPITNNSNAILKIFNKRIDLIKGEQK